MATGVEKGKVEQLMERFEKSADFTIYNSEFFCTLCLDEGNEVQAIVYCQDCKEFFCDDCRSQHCRFRKFQEHVLLDKSVFDERGRQPTSSLSPKTKCSVPNHYGTLLTIYCETHRIDCCPNCAVKDHEKCQLKFIPEAAKGISKSKEFHDAISCFQDLQNQYMELKITIATEKHEMQIERETIVDTIDEFRKKVNKQLEELQHNTDKILAERYNLQDLHLAIEIGRIDSRLEEIERHLNETSKLRRSECELYVRYMNGKFLTEELEKELATLRKRKKRPPIRFVLERRLERMFDGISVFGNVIAQWDMKYLHSVLTD